MRLSKIYTAFFLSLPTVSLANNNVSAELAEISVIASKDAFHWANHTSEKLQTWILLAAQGVLHKSRLFGA